MQRWTIARAVLAVLLPLTAADAQTSSHVRPVAGGRGTPLAALVGSWEGRLDFGKALQTIRLHVPAAAPESATIDLPESNRLGLPVTALTVRDSGVRFGFEGRLGPAEFDGTLRDGAVTGRFRQGELAASFLLVRTLPPDLPRYRRYAGSYEISPGHVIDVGPFREAGDRLAFVDSRTRRTGVLYATSDSEFFAGPTVGLAYPKVAHVTFVAGRNGGVSGLRWRDSAGHSVTARRVGHYREEEIIFRNGDVTMHGTLTLPSGLGPHPVVVMVPGSGYGPPRPGGFFPYFMVRQGVGMLTFDKRGTGASTGDWRTASYEDLADDLLSAVAALKTRPDVDARRIGLWGNSEGGWTAPLAASRSRDVAFVIIRGASALPVTEAVAREAELRLRDGTELTDAEIRAAVDFKQAVERIALSPEPWAAVWPRIDSAYASVRAQRWAQYVAGPPQDHWWWQWWRLRGGYDPAPALERLTMPVLVLLGEKDCCMPPADANAAAFRRAFTRGGNRSAAVHVLPSGNHGLMEAQTGYMSEGVRLSRYVPGYLDRIAEWVRP